jgi:toluene monooxygenase system protein B
MAEIPLATSFEGDFILKLVVVDEDDTMDQVAAKTAAHTAGRTAPANGRRVLRVRRQGSPTPLARAATVAAVKLGPMECIEVYHVADER